MNLAFLLTDRSADSVQHYLDNRMDFGFMLEYIHCEKAFFNDAMYDTVIYSIPDDYLNL